MASIEEQLKELGEKRIRLWNRAKEVYDRAAEEHRDLTAEERYNTDRLEEDIQGIEKLSERIMSSGTAREEFEQVTEAFASISTRGERADLAQRDQRMAEDLRSLMRPPSEGNSLMDRTRAINQMDLDMTEAARHFAAVRQGFTGNELRVIMTDAGAASGSLTVPTTVANTIYSFMVQSNNIRRIARVITTAGGAPMNFPRTGTHGVATQVAAQTTALAGSDPILTSMTMTAYDYGQLLPVSNDMLQDSGVDVLSYVAEQIGRGLGIVTGHDYVLGTGSGQPTGISNATAVGANGTVATGGSLIIGTGIDSFVDLQYSVADQYRNSGCAFLMHQLTGGLLRKARDGAGGTVGAYVWQPSPTVGVIPGQPDRLLGDPVYFDSNVGSLASAAKIAYYGAWDRFYIRDASTLSIQRSDDLYFNLNQVAFRGIIRTDSNLIDTKAINLLTSRVA